MLHVKTLIADFVYSIQIPVYSKTRPSVKNYMKELMAHINCKQDVDGCERPTSTFIIRICDGIKFCNQ
jgi:hypothetical protein